MKLVNYFLLLLLAPLIAFSQNVEIAQIDSLMKGAFERGIFNGNILVYHQGKKIYQRSFGFADLRKKIPLSAEMKFDIGSISKEFNGVAIMMLKEKGMLTLDDPISDFFPNFPDWAKKVKIRHILNYTSGIPILGTQYDGSDSLILKSLQDLKNLAAEPGNTYIYNHINVSLQRRIIEKLSGLTYAEYVGQNIFNPLKMVQSVVDLPIESAGMAQAFDESGNHTPYGQQGVKGWIRLPINDLYKWINALATHKLITAQSLKELGENFPGGESSLGTTNFKGNTLTFHQHQGSNSNYEAAFYHNVTEKIIILMMTNNQQMKVWPLKTAIVQILNRQAFEIPKKSLYLTIRDKFLNDFDEGMRFYKELKANSRDRYDFSFEIGDLISTGKYLQRRSNFNEAIKIYKVAATLNYDPKDLSYAHELIGECYLKLNDKQNALLSYQNAIFHNPLNKNAAGMIAEINKNF